jgi:hypothetical protein
VAEECFAQRCRCEVRRLHETVGGGHVLVGVSGEGVVLLSVVGDLFAPFICIRVDGPYIRDIAVLLAACVV